MRIEPGTALEQTTTGPNGLTTTWQVDGFGRTVLETRPDATTTATQYLDCAGGCPGGAVRQVRVTASGVAPVTTSFDLLGREVRTQTLGFGARTVVQDTEYDALGRVARTSVPSYAGDPVYWTRQTYDLMDRVVTVTAPDDSVTATAYAGYTTTVTNALGPPFKWEMTRPISMLLQSRNSVRNECVHRRMPPRLKACDRRLLPGRRRRRTAAGARRR